MNFVTGERACAPSPLASLKTVPCDLQAAEAPQASATDGTGSGPVASSAGDGIDGSGAGLDVAANAGASGLAGLLAQARAAQQQLAGQPLPIANHKLSLIQKLFGG